ncbi:TetR/AcrR family transcriptional regulator [Parasphingorhabdus sp.]|jgi:AcrR family transcriptional regulator|uniref:TetR/AcrR family transcriptional regulator n=1 Tax=Parasphingorhabdus sp. TaxID=2709688 RepID=UPI001B7730E8|nr:TetR family transcriptional regulator [Parasphingorhabdus sp.]MBQ0771688.1 TetR family transcriptional regulator [Sphingomonadales bacterium]|tara:strand:+ start:614 stop:1177 length:564 start_codon:yes stop_codon:yes gene_type:complete
MVTATNDKTRDAARTRNAILHAAQHIFAEKGFTETGVRDITDRAGVNQSLVSRYFGGKLKLFEAALENALDVRIVTDLTRENFGKLVVENFILSPANRTNPLPILLGAVADSEASAIALRLLHDRIFGPFRDWFGGDEAVVRAARFMIVSTGFFTYRDQLPLAPFVGAVDPGLRQWLETEFQAIVDG